LRTLSPTFISRGEEANMYGIKSKQLKAIATEERRQKRDERRAKRRQQKQLRRRANQR
jgi:hypothetical protein